MKNIFNLLSLSSRNFWILMLLLGTVSIFGPKGLFRLLVMKQEVLRLETDAAEISMQIARLEREIADFRQSTMAQERAIRSELGLLLDHEWSVEFPTLQKDNP